MAQLGNQKSGQASKVISINDARDRYDKRERSKRIQPTPDQFDLAGCGFDRLSDEAREYFWFNVTNYARDLTQTAAAYCDAEGEQPNGAVTPYHVEAAEAQRLSFPAPKSRFGLGFTLDAVQMVGAATCGALVARPGATDGASFVAFAFALMLTVGTFLLRQSMPDSYTSTAQ